MPKLEQDLPSSYRDLDPDVSERIIDVADRQRGKTWQDIASSVPPVRHFTAKGSKPIEVLDIPAKGDEEGVLLYETAMAIPIDRTTVVSMATLSEAIPNQRIIAIGNPGRPGHGFGKIPLVEMGRVASGQLQAIVRPAFDYLESKQITRATFVGHSRGSLIAVAGGEYADGSNAEVPRVIAIDPPFVKDRAIWEIARAFFATGSSMDTLYAKLADSRANDEARAIDAKDGGGIIGYGWSLLRPTNLAQIYALTRDSLESRIDTAISVHPDMKVHLVWGTDSQLSVHSLMLAKVARLIQKHGADHISTTQMQGHNHAMASHHFLLAGMVAQGLK